jgi:large subunit ribosomal protein L3
MAIGLIGKKCGMTRVFTDAGVAIPVTVIEVLPNHVTQVKTKEHEGYSAIQVTSGKKRVSLVDKALTGHYAKAKIEAGKGLWEFRSPDAETKYKVGDAITVELFKDGQMVDVTGVTKGKGFAGVLKRHHFSGQDATHGNSLSHRVHGSTGQRQTPGRVFKNKKMAGHLGNVNRTIQNQVIVRIDKQRNLLLVRGAVPGATGGNVIIKPAVKAEAE